MNKQAKLMNITEYAKHRKKNGLRGSTRQAVHKAIRERRIECEENGKICPQKADQQWAIRTQMRLYMF